MSEEKAMMETNRLGPQEKCPACGWRLDADAYRCPKCMIYFCYKCRRRLAATDPQYQCLNQKCQYYGKLVCEVCTESVTKLETLQGKEVVVHGCEERIIRNAIICGAVGVLLSEIVLWLVNDHWLIMALILYLIPSLVVGLISFGIALGVGYSQAKKKGLPIHDETRDVTTQYPVESHKACITCKMPVQILHK